MRFMVEILLSGDQLVIPSDYRRNILSLIKEAINPNQSGTDVYNQYYSQDRILKPFTFSVSFRTDETKNKKGIMHLTDPQLSLYFSASDPVFLIYVYNGLVQLKKDYPLFPGLKAKTGHFNLEQQKIIRDPEVIFRTFSPILVRDTGEGRKTQNYLTVESPVFMDRLYHSVRYMCGKLLDGDYKLAQNDFAAEFINSKTVRINHYYKDKDTLRDSKKELIEATAGIIKIKAPANVLQLIYDAGIGAKRSQGFGMLEIL
ncbi:MAG: CRISPR-associated endoribonuclease Cas6 [Smithella sp.]|nr:CRISPR-associated endoribonuclease Cas6 [Smithella sp.]